MPPFPCVRGNALGGSPNFAVGESASVRHQRGPLEGARARSSANHDSRLGYSETGLLYARKRSPLNSVKLRDPGLTAPQSIDSSDSGMVCDLKGMSGARLGIGRELRRVSDAVEDGNGRSAEQVFRERLLLPAR